MLRDNNDQTPINLAGIDYFPIESIDVAEFHEEDDGKGDPTQVHLIFHIGDSETDIIDGPLPIFVCRMKSRRIVDKLITSLITHSRRVWPDA